MIIEKISHAQSSEQNDICHKLLLVKYPNMISILHTPDFHIVHFSDDYKTTNGIDQNGSPNTRLELNTAFRDKIQTELDKTNIPEKQKLQKWIDSHDFK